MKIRLFALSVIILWCSTICYGAERRKSHDSIPSPSGTLAYAVDAEKRLTSLELTDEMVKRGEELKQAKYSTGPKHQEIASCIEALSNSDIRWDGTFFGLSPVLEGEVAKRLPSFDSQATPALITALDDPEKFVAAHVLLTLIHYKRFSTSASQWNGLAVKLHADGSIVIDPGQIPTIKAMWEKEVFRASDGDEDRSQK